MRKAVLNIIETTLIIIVGLVCVVSILQSTIFQNKAVCGYHTYVIASNSMYPTLKYGDVILVKEIDFNNIKKGDIITYYGKEGEVKNKIITHEVIDILTENETTVLKTKGEANTGVDPYVYKDQVYGKFQYRFIVISFLSKIIRDKIGFVICILVPFSILFILELISVTKEIKRKELENTMKLQLEELNQVTDNSELCKAIEQTIQIQLKEIQEAKRDFKKINELQETIQVPLEEIQNQIRLLNSKLSKIEKTSENEEIDKTIVMDDKSINLKEAIEQELEKREENKQKKSKTKQKNQTVSVDKNRKPRHKPTTPVDKRKRKSKTSTVSVDKK